MNEITADSNHALGELETMLPSCYGDPRWYAAYTSANHEKRVAEQLALRSVEHFLPLYQSVRRWKDRTVRLQLPLFPGYVFLRLALCERLRVLQLPSVVRLVGFGDAPVALDDEEIAGLRRAVGSGIPMEPHPFLKAGRRVRITSGPLAGREGVLKRWKGDLRVLLSIDLIQRSVLVDIDVSSVAPIDPARTRTLTAERVAAPNSGNVRRRSDLRATSRAADASAKFIGGVNADLP